MAFHRRLPWICDPAEVLAQSVEDDDITIVHRYPPHPDAPTHVNAEGCWCSPWVIMGEQLKHWSLADVGRHLETHFTVH